MSTRPVPLHREHRTTIQALSAWKAEGRRFSMLTAYDYCFARIFDQAGIDILLVGDSLGNVFQGEDTTLPVTIEDVVYHTRAVSRAAKRAMVVGDMPFGSYQISPEEAVRNAVSLIKVGGAHAVKLEGGSAVRKTIARIVAAEIPVMGHVGLTPQSVHRMGGFRVQGRTQESRKRVLEDAHAVEDAGAFSVVLEGLPAEFAEEISHALTIPTIGIGAGPKCDGQVLVMHDMLGLNGEWVPSFVKKYAELGKLVSQAAESFASEVAEGTFPSSDHCYR